MTTPLTQRSARRMLRRSRSVWAAAAVLVAAVATGFVVFETVRFALGLPAWVAGPRTIIDTVSGGTPVGVAIGAVALVFGVVCLWGAVSPGRAGRRLSGDERAPLVVDDAVLAGSLSRSAARTAGVAPDQVRTHVARRRADIEVTPSSGFPVAADEVARAGSAGIASLELTPRVRTRARVTGQGALS
ncbi:hypothetical protein [Microbacterium sp. PA5]|uniref:hypothetical protein n=1 Tax=Microbacterium sp. PA5 TaxID=3416654 RepID=UPI003CEA6383